MTKPAAMRLDRLLANLGYGSRREVQALARNGRVMLDGAEIDVLDAKIILSDDLPARLSVDGDALDPLPGMVLMLHKPVGMTCSHKEAGPLVYSLLPERWRRREPALSTVGRLDKETSGLLLLTDDGAFLHRVISPRASIAKSYRARLAQLLRGDEAALFASGAMSLEGEAKPLLPAGLEAVSAQEAVVTIFEGRYHQVRRMFAAAGNNVVALHRVSIGALTLPDDLAPGEFRLLARHESASIFAPASAAVAQPG